MYLEFVNPNQELLKSVQSIKDIEAKGDVQKALDETGKILRGILNKWAGKLSPNFVKTTESAIELTKSPAIAGEMPKLPNADAYDSSDPKQMDEFKAEVQKTFELMKNWLEVKESYAKKPIPDVHSRNMQVSRIVDDLISRLIPEKKHVTRMPSGDEIYYNDNGKGQMVGKVKDVDIDIKHAQSLASLNYYADQAGFRAVNVKDPVLESEDPTLESDLNSMTKAQLIEVGKKAGKELDSSMKKDEMVKILMGG